jgi:hypothetical protein
MRNGPYELMLAPDGYPGKRYRGKYAYEHHIVWWMNTGTLPAPDELIHHKNENKRDNVFGNLELKTRAKHSAEHSAERAPPRKTFNCGWCGWPILLRACDARERIRKSKTGSIFCSRSCGAQHQFAVLNTECGSEKTPPAGTPAALYGATCALESRPTSTARSPARRTRSAGAAAKKAGSTSSRCSSGAGTH